jgi:hypothetical protein
VLQIALLSQEKRAALEHCQVAIALVMAVAAFQISGQLLCQL